MTNKMAQITQEEGFSTFYKILTESTANIQEISGKYKNKDPGYWLRFKIYQL